MMWKETLAAVSAALYSLSARDVHRAQNLLRAAQEVHPEPDTVWVGYSYDVESGNGPWAWAGSTKREAYRKFADTILRDYANVQIKGADWPTFRALHGEGKYEEAVEAFFENIHHWEYSIRPESLGVLLPEGT